VEGTQLMITQNDISKKQSKSNVNKENDTMADIACQAKMENNLQQPKTMLIIAI